MRFSLLSLLALTLAWPARAAENAPAARDLAGFLRLFEGEFDNFQQVFAEKEAKAADVHEHIHSIFKRVALPSLGEHVFYVEQYMDGDPGKTYRQRLYTFRDNPAEDAIELKIWSLPDEKAAKGAHLDPSKLAGITAATARPMPEGCEVYWRPDGQPGRFLGSMKKDACRIASTRSGKTLVISDDLLLDADQIWIRYTGTQAPILKLAVYEKGNPVAAAYTWANPEAQRIGINLRWIQAGLVREGAK